MISAVREKCAGLDVHRDTLRPKLRHQGAIIALAHALVYAIYNVLAFQRPYREVATAELGQAEAARLIRHHQSRIQHLRAFLTKPPRPDLAHLLSRLGKEE